MQPMLEMSCRNEWPLPRHAAESKRRGYLVSCVEQKMAEDVAPRVMKYTVHDSTGSELTSCSVCSVPDGPLLVAVLGMAYPGPCALCNWPPSREFTPLARQRQDKG